MASYIQEAFETKTAEQRNFGASDTFVCSQHFPCLVMIAFEKCGASQLGE